MLFRRSVALERHFGVTPERIELLAFIDFPFDDRIENRSLKFEPVTPRQTSSRFVKVADINQADHLRLVEHKLNYRCAQHL